MEMVWDVERVLGPIVRVWHISQEVGKETAQRGPASRVWGQCAPPKTDPRRLAGFEFVYPVGRIL